MEELNEEEMKDVGGACVGSSTLGYISAKMYQWTDIAAKPEASATIIRWSVSKGATCCTEGDPRMITGCTVSGSKLRVFCKGKGKCELQVVWKNNGWEMKKKYKIWIH